MRRPTFAITPLLATALLWAACSSADKPPPEVAAQGHMTWEIIPERTTVPEGEPIRAAWVIRNTLGATVRLFRLPTAPAEITGTDGARVKCMEPVGICGGADMRPPPGEDFDNGETLSGTFTCQTAPNAPAWRTAPRGRYVLSCSDSLTAVNGAAVRCIGTPVTIDVVAPPASTLTAPEPDPAWNAFFNRTSGWTGGDIGSSIDLGAGRTLWLFGDSWIGPVRDNRHAEGTIMVRNAMAVHPSPPEAGTPPAFDSPTFAWSRPRFAEPQPQWLGPANAPRRFESPFDKTWYWPMGDGLVVLGTYGSQRLILFAIAIGPSGAKDGTWDFRTVGGVICVINNFTDEPSRWNIRQIDNPHVGVDPRADAPTSSVKQPSTDLWASAAVFTPWSDTIQPSTTMVHLFGTRDAGAGGRQLLHARASMQSVEDPSTWEFRTKDGWSRNSADAAPIADGFPTEFTIRYLEIDGRGVWVAIHSEPMFGHHIQARTALRPEGPWSAPKNIYLVPEVEADKRLITYAHKAHPLLSPRGELLVSYIVNSSDFGQVMGDASLYRPPLRPRPAQLSP